MILASPVPVAQFVDTTSYGFSFESPGESRTIAAPNYNVPLPNNFLTSTQPESLLLAAADYTTPQPDNLLLTDYTIPQPDMRLIANTEDPKAVEICRNQGNCGLLGNPIPTSPDLSPPITPDLQWLNDKTSQSMTTEFVNFRCGNLESVCCENWHKIPAAQSESQTASTQNLWLSCSNSISALPLPTSAATLSFSNSFALISSYRAIRRIRWIPWDCP